MNWNPQSVAVTALCLLLLQGCEHPEGPTWIRVENGPAFSLRGKGHLAEFKVYAPRAGTKVANPFEETTLVWQIKGPDSFFHGTRIDGLKLIYGHTPRAYIQVVPADSLTAPQLTSGRIYSFSASSTLAGTLGGEFYVDKAGAVKAVNVSPCSVSKNGQIVRVDCTTRELFHEPSDIEQYVRDHERASAFTPSPVDETDR